MGVLCALLGMGVGVYVRRRKELAEAVSAGGRTCATEEEGLPPADLDVDGEAENMVRTGVIELEQPSLADVAGVRMKKGGNQSKKYRQLHDDSVVHPSSPSVDFSL